MTVANQSLGCTVGDTFAFAITMQPNPDATIPDLTGATATWDLLEGDFAEAVVLIHKTIGTGVSITQIDGAWTIIVGLTPTDTAIAPGLYYHKCELTLADGSKSHPETGPFVLSF